MNKYYTVFISQRRLRHATDMLRYDGAFYARPLRDNPQVWEILTTNHTPARWASFNVTDFTVNVHKCTDREWQVLQDKATGFIEGVRFAQSLMVKCTEEGRPLLDAIMQSQY